MKRLSLLERILVVLIGSGILLGTIFLPVIIMAYAKTWMIVVGFIVAFIYWVKEVTSCE